VVKVAQAAAVLARITQGVVLLIKTGAQGVVEAIKVEDLHKIAVQAVVMVAVLRVLAVQVAQGVVVLRALVR
jgi:hypothetical protein